MISEWAGLGVETDDVTCTRRRRIIEKAQPACTAQYWETDVNPRHLSFVKPDKSGR